MGGQATFSFANRRVLISGGAQGIGFAIGKRFLEAGAHVVLADFSSEALRRAERDLGDFSSTLTCLRADVTDRAGCHSLAASLGGVLHVLINNAGITRDKSLHKMTDADFDDVIQTNLTGVYNVTKAVLEKFDPQTRVPKRIVNMASVVALYGNFGQTNYVAAKAGVIGMTKTWARELGRKGFTVNAIAPGFIRTSMAESLPKDILEGISAKVPCARLGDPTDIANACLFLASDGAGYINGTVLSVDRGLIL